MLWTAGWSMSQEPAPAEKAKVTFHFDAPVRYVGPGVSTYTVDVHEDGTGSYAARVRGAAGEQAQEVAVALSVSAGTVGKIFEQARGLQRFNVACASKAKGIADSGEKTLGYAGPDGAGSCHYNYSDNKMVAALTTTFEGMAFTLEEGRRLAFKHKYDRLGLDGEMTLLYTAVQDGRAQEMGVIAPVLRSLVEDMDVLERVRMRAETLLKMGAGK